MGAFEQGNNAELCFKKITWGVCDEVGQEQSQVLPVQEVKNGASVYLQPAIAHECCHNVFGVFQSYVSDLKTAIFTGQAHTLLRAVSIGTITK